MFHRAISTQQIHCLCQLKGNGSVSIYFLLVIIISLWIDQFSGTILSRILVCGCVWMCFFLFFILKHNVCHIISFTQENDMGLKAFPYKNRDIWPAVPQNHHWLHSLWSENITARISHTQYLFLTNHTKGGGHRRKKFCPVMCWKQAARTPRPSLIKAC